MSESAKHSDDPNYARNKRRLVFGLTGGVAALAVAATAVAASTGGAGTSGDSSAQSLKVMSLNTWHGGAKVSDGVNKIAHQVKSSGADIVALQESSSPVAKEIAGKLGWKYHTASGTDVDVISKKPIEKTDSFSKKSSGAKAIAAKIQGVWVYSIHLDYTKYGPYNACFDEDGYQQIYADEASRKAQAQDIAEWTGSAPAIVAGDFNTPSHLDWTEGTKAKHCNSAVEWPATKVFSDKGFKDSYRELHPSPAKVPGNTWSPVTKKNSDYGNKPEPQDRIDFILHKGGSLKPVTSHTFGGGSGWPSDHLAVLTTFHL
ncbi:endonuclease/exonuclease/phosphatase family protein [Streptomyces halobius]|uniref:Endonuclease/exonuclease/phosphatase family protein n=1 Tax=Streptomyces halobius TaxID=2879846 RepID=A0ABY4M2S0_9ACTN|nr:endonuclease/exonuclease/phosphatase family protein [Streptomyces halobius]UQA92064.1 endonuclease/exonuclease/phosphatase family protein [Streptomyces halobius]